MPILQKDLFNKTIVAKLKTTLTSGSNEPNLIYIWGPIGCGKSETINVLCKNWNINSIDPDRLRKNEEFDQIIKNLIHSRGVSKWTLGSSSKSKSSGKELILLDGIQICEKTIKAFIQILLEHKLQITVVMISTQEIKSINSIENVTTFSFPKPSLLELFRLAFTKRPDLTKDTLEDIVKRSNYDIRQLLVFLNQNTVANESISQDYDLQEKIEMILSDNKRDIDFVYSLGSSEPGILSNGIFSNYLHTKNPHLENLEKIIDSLSLSDLASSGVSINTWESADIVTTLGCVIPHYYTSVLPRENYTSGSGKGNTHYKSYEEIIINQWVKEEKIDNIVDYIISNNLYTRNSTGECTISFTVRVKLSKSMRTKILENIQSKLTTSKRRIKEPTVESITLDFSQWCKTAETK
jgi:hypothetical protein